jgi:hypothetical protein
LLESIFVSFEVVKSLNGFLSNKLVPVFIISSLS